MYICSLITHPLILEVGLLKKQKTVGTRNVGIGKAGDEFGAAVVMFLYMLVLTQENSLPF